MRLKRLEVRYWRQHQKLDLKFKTGVTGIFGPNGRGKSNLLRAIRFNLTGTWGDEATKEGNINKRMPEGEKAYVLCEWVHEEQELTLTRHLPSKQSLIVGDKKITSEGEITLYLTELLERPMRSIQELWFVQQGDKMFDFLMAKPEERSKSYAYLCGTEDLEVLWKAIGDQISSDQHLASTVVDNTASLENQLAEFNRRLGELGDQQAAARKSILKKKLGTKYKDVVKRYRRLEYLKEQIASLDVKIKDRKPKVEKSSKRLETLRTRAEGLQGRLAKRAKKAKRYERIKDRLKESGDRNRRIKELRAITDKAPPEKPKEPRDFEPPAILKSRLDRLKEDLAEARRVLKVFDETGVVECPTCGTPVTELDEHLADKRAFVLDNEGKPAEMQALLTRCEAYDKAKFAWDRAMNTHETQVQMASDELQGLDKPEDPLETPEDLVVWLEEHAQLQVKSTNADSILSKAAKKHAGIEASLKSLENIREEYRVEHDTITGEVSQEDYEAAEKALNAHRSALALVEQIDPQIDSTIQDIKRATGDLAEINIAKERSQAGNKWIADLTAYREVVHRDNLQRIITQSYLEELVGQINEKLESFDGPFRVSPGDALTMNVHKADGTETPSTLLSGGEKVVLAIAYRMAVNPGEMLVLDEPTANLDTHNMGCLTDVLDNLRGLTKKQGRQIIMVTHDERLERVFDRVIRL